MDTKREDGNMPGPELDDPYDAARRFAQLFAEMEFGLKRSSFLKKGRPDAQADWAAFARSLGDDFFISIEKKGLAPLLIGEPPRKLFAQDLEWLPRDPAPLTTTVELIVEGVCRVRNSYIHGEKFVGGPAGQWKRDAQLIREAYAVLKEAAGLSS